MVTDARDWASWGVAAVSGGRLFRAFEVFQKPVVLGGTIRIRLFGALFLQLMNRNTISVRPNWREKVESVGLSYHTHDHGTYWDESACYQLSSAEVDQLEAAGNEVHQRCLEAAQHVIDQNLWDRLAIPEIAVPAIRASWDRDDFSLYGRFDFAFDGETEPKLLEYNADTPTALIEASVAQWFWLQDSGLKADQFNSIHERLIEAWKRSSAKELWLCAVQNHPEDAQTVRYLQDTAIQAGCRTEWLWIEEMGWDASNRRFVDRRDRPIGAAFKLYPWEWMWFEPFGQHLATDSTRWFEPMWKMILSNKGLLPILHELFPGHPNLLPAFERPEPLRGSFVKKPKLSREGSNVTLVQNGATLDSTDGEYGEEGFVYQAVAPTRGFEGNWPVCGVWIVDHEAAGMGIREDRRRITNNLSRFVPHLF